MLKLEDGTYQVSICVNQVHIHQKTKLRQRRLLIEKYCEESCVEAKSVNLKKYLKKNGIEELSSSQVSYYLKKFTKKH